MNSLTHLLAHTYHTRITHTNMPHLLIHSHTHTYCPRELRQLHMSTCEELKVEATVRVEVVKLLDQLQQLLVGICLIQVGYCGHPQVHF